MAHRGGPAEDWLPGRLVVLAAMVGMLVVGLAVPAAFGRDALLFGTAYLVVRALHVALYAVATPPETRAAVIRATPGFLGAPVLLALAGLFDGPLEVGLWVLALAVDYGTVYVRGVAGFHVEVGHFVERHRLVLIIALGESLVAIGLGAAGLPLAPAIVAAALVGIALGWLYFDYVALAAEQRLARETGDARAALARDSYSYLHLPIVGSIVFVAVGIERTLAHVAEPLGLVPAVALFGGAAVYLAGHNAFRYRDWGNVSRLRLGVTVVALLLIPIAGRVPGLASLVALTLLFVATAYETVRSEYRGYFRPG